MVLDREPKLLNSNQGSFVVEFEMSDPNYKNDPVFKKMGFDLGFLHQEYVQYLEAGGRPSSFEPSNSLMPVADGWVIMDFVAAENPEFMLADLEALGLEGASKFGSTVSGMIPIDKLGDLNEMDSLKFARAAIAETNIGLTTSQGDEAMRADVARDIFGVDGSGVSVGILSDSYDNLDGESADIHSGDIPGPGNPLGNTTPVNVLQELPSEDPSFPGNDEGRGIAQLIHDVAPGSALAFHTAFLGQADFANGIIELANQAGSDVIVDDVIYLAEPMFQDGIIAQAVDQVVTDGTSYFSSAGNRRRNSYESEFNDSGQGVPIFGGTFHDFDPGPGVDVFQSVTIPEGSTLIISFQWDSPFFSVSGGAGSPNDLDIFLYDSTGTIPLAGGIDNNIGTDAVELFGFTNDGSFGTDEFNLAISQFAGPEAGFIKYVRFSSSAVTVNEYDTQSPTTYGHNNSNGAEAVGAAFYHNTPEFGVNPARLEPFSSAGGTPILFDAAGNRLSTPEVRQKPEIVGPDGINTTFFPPSPLNQRDREEDGFPNFFGTSASAPHAAAIAALMLQASPGTSPEIIYQTLESTALDMDDPATPGFDVGFDNGSGFGFVQAEKAIQALLGIPSNTPSIHNGGFERGFTNWETLGDASIQTASFGVEPTERKKQALLTNSSSSVNDLDLEVFVGLQPGELDLLNDGFTTEGSAIKQTIDVSAGDTLSFDWNFLTDENTPDSLFNDFAFVSITPGTAFEIADTRSDFISSITIFNEETEYSGFTYTFESSGSFTLAVGVVDVVDNEIDSALLVDNFSIS